VSDRRLWLEERCSTCGARPGLRCQTSRYGGKPSRVLHGARGWRHRSCPTCKAQPGELCRTPTGRQPAGPHTARLNYGRRELFADEDVWQELERWGASAALVRFSGGGGSPGSIAAVTLEDAGKKELARWGSPRGRAVARPRLSRSPRDFRGRRCEASHRTSTTARQSAPATGFGISRPWVRKLRLCRADSSCQRRQRIARSWNPRE
jgi:hypothetical protein